MTQDPSRTSSQSPKKSSPGDSRRTLRRRLIWSIVALVVLLLITLTGSSAYMIGYSLSPDPNRSDTDSCYRLLFERYPQTRSWTDSLRKHQVLRDTFVTMPTGERHHAYHIKKGDGNRKTAFVIHGWRDQAIKFFAYAQIYEQALGYNVVIPDLHAHGQSEGEAVGMGWHDKDDVRHWLEVFKTDTIVVHGVSMGAATTMMLSGEALPEGIQDIRFIEDCGYTSVWDEFAGEMRNQFDLPPFPLMYTSSLLCKLRYGWSFGEASALLQVKKCRYPMLFIHGDSDTFVPTEMVYRLYEAKPGEKELWVTENTEHAASLRNHPEAYLQKVRSFLNMP